MLRSLGLISLVLVLACDQPRDPGETAGAPPEGGGGNGDGAAGGGGAAPLATLAPFDILDYADGSGTLFRVPISVNGSAPFGVLLDTGSDGLRVFASALEGTALDVTGDAVTVEFGFGNRMVGHLAHAEVAFGGVQTSGPIALHLVEELSCSPASPSCDFANGDAPFFDAVGVRGILGVSTRRGSPQALFSPFAQLAPPLSNGFLIRAGGFGASSGEIVFGPPDDALAGFGFVDLAPNGAHPNGLAAWRDDAVTACFEVNGAPLDPPCTEAVFDTGASVDVIYAPALPAALDDGGVLAPGATLATTVEGALEMEITVANPQTPSVDLVFLDDTQPFALLGIGAYLRHDVVIDLANGRLGFRAHE